MPEFVTRKQLLELLNEFGLPTGKGQLDKLIWLGEGPPKAGRWGRADIFRREEVRDWARRRLQGKSEAA